MRSKTREYTFALLLACVSTVAFADPIQITVHADRVIEPVNKLLSGICIEDVNHEIYGGLYSQMIFGESFQEPSLPPAIAGFRAFGGNWNVVNGTVEIDGNDGPKLVSDHTPFADGVVSVEMQFANSTGENAGLIVRARQPGIGPDAFTGYEISLDPARQKVRLARHRNNYELISEAACDVPTSKWISLQVKLTGHAIEIVVDGNNVLRHHDGDESLAAGTVALRAWHSNASFRNLSLQTAGQSEKLLLNQPTTVGDVSGMWRPIVQGSAVASFALDGQGPFIGTQSQKISFESGEGEVGIENRGLNHWGMNCVAGKPYDGYLWVKADNATKLIAALESSDGSKTYTRQSLDVSAGDWHRIDLSLTPNASDHSGRFTLKLKQIGSVTLGHVFLQPGEWGRFKSLPVRRDVVDAIIDQGVSVMRYGGSMVNAPTYQWKNMIGARDRRPPYKGTWYPYSSNGWGVIDFLNLCEATGIEGIPDLNANESPQDMADFIEYVNGPADSEWGKRRATDGHSQPYHLKHLELGNEEKVDSAFAQKFNALADAIWKKDPDVILVVGDFGYRHKITDPNHITDTDGGINNLDGQKQILEFAQQHNREVWFDVHVWSENLDPSINLQVLPSFMDAIDNLANGTKHKVVVFELNANSHGQMRALANAVSINTLRRDNRMPVIISANGLQPDRQNDNGWDQGLLFLNPWEVWLQAPGYITQMQARDDLPQLIKCDVQGAEASHLDVTAIRSEDGKAIVVQVVNTGSAATTTIDLSGFVFSKPTAHVTELAVPLKSENTAEKPNAFHPKESDLTYEIHDRAVTKLFPAHSFTIIRFN